MTTIRSYKIKKASANSRARNARSWNSWIFYRYLNIKLSKIKTHVNKLFLNLSEVSSFSHSKKTTLNDGRTITAEEIDNINPFERGTDKKSHVIAIVYEGKRSSLGKSTYEYSLTKKAKKYIENIFMNSPKEKAPVKKRSKK